MRKDEGAYVAGLSPGRSRARLTVARNAHNPAEGPSLKWKFPAAFQEVPVASSPVRRFRRKPVDSGRLCRVENHERSSRNGNRRRGHRYSVCPLPWNTAAFSIDPRALVTSKNQDHVDVGRRLSAGAVFGQLTSASPGPGSSCPNSRNNSNVLIPVSWPSLKSIE